MLDDYLREYGLSAEQISNIKEYYPNVDSVLSAEDYEIAAIGEMKIEDVKRLKEFLNAQKKGIARDFLKRWGKVLSEESVEKTYEEYDKLSKLQPKSPVVWQIKGELLEKMGKYDESKKAFEKAKKLYEERGEIPPALINERLHGMSYRISSRGDGIGLINGLGFQNGRRSKINGFSNGLSNGVSNGFKNGIINGEGLVNGSGRYGRRGKRRAPPIFRFFISVVLIVVMIYAPLMGLFFFESGPAYVVDGQFQEWNHGIPYLNFRSAPAVVNITEVKFHLENKGLFFFVHSQEPLFTVSSGIYVFIDSDMDSHTGYSVGNIGAEYMAEVYGWNQSIQGRTLYFFNSTDQNDFSKFVSIGSISAAMNGNRLEGFIPHHFERFRSVVISTNYAGAGAITYVPRYGEQVLYLREERYSSIIPLNHNTPVLKIKTYSASTVQMKNISFAFNGTASPLEMDTVNLYMDNGNGIFDQDDRQIAKGITNGPSIVEFNGVDINVRNSTLFLVVRCSQNYLLERAIVARIYSIDANISYEVDNFVDGGSYIGRIPSEPHVDGSFLDWNIKKGDSIGDVMDPTGHINPQDPNIDILNYSSYSENHILYFVSVNGEIMGGTDCPLTRMFSLPDSDGDTVPDRFDIYPHDFNNDGIPDENSTVVVNGEKLPDVDGDEIADYPYGPDMWLNTTIPDNFPRPYAGKAVHRYIGPTPAEEVYGYDVLYILINTDGNNRTGFSLPQYPIGAEYKIEIYGRGGKVENASVFQYSGHWEYVRNVKYFIGYHSIEMDSGISAPTQSSLIILTDWDNDRDISDSPLVSSATRSDYAHKQLHLHYNNSANEPYMDTHPGSNALYVNIPADNYFYWIMDPSFSENFEISSAPMVSLYVDPHPLNLFFYTYIPGLNVSLHVYNYSTESLTLIGYDYNPDLEETGWYNFTIRNTTTVKKGESLVLVAISVGANFSRNLRTSVDIYFNSTEYDSQIDMPTSTYVNVDWIKTYNSTSQKSLFDGGEHIRIRSRVSDPFGYDDIADARLYVKYPNGTYLIFNASMSIESEDGPYRIYHYDFTAPVVPGEYDITVVGVESNGVLAQLTSEFFVKTQRGVAICPDLTEYGNPGEDVNFYLTAINIGNVADGYYIQPSPSSEHFGFEMLINGSIAARDTDGDGIWNWINDTWERDDNVYIYLNPGEWVNISIVKNVPQGTWGLSDLLNITAVSTTNSSISDSARIRTNVPVLSVEKPLFLHGNNKLALKHGTSERSKRINYNDQKTWSFDKVYYDVNLTGYIVVNLYIKGKPSRYSDVAVTVSLYSDSTLIGDDRIIISDDTARWYLFTIVPSIDTIPAQSQISLTVSVKGYRTSATIYYDSDAHPSNVTIPTSDHMKIRGLKLYNSSGETYNFSAGEELTVRAILTSPFGVDDIGNAYVNITDSTGEREVNAETMDLLSSSDGKKVFEYTYALPDDAWSGHWVVGVESHDDPVLRVNASVQFFILWDVNITPNHNITVNTSSQDRYFYFNHTITNTGLGANIFEIVAHSANGFDVKLIINGNLVAEDYNGDGVWDYVDSSWDMDGDGNPDTGILLPGESESIEIAVKIPANFTGNETVNVKTYSFLSQGINDHAYDRISTVPEIENIIIILPIAAVIFLIKRKGRLTLS